MLGRRRVDEVRNVDFGAAASDCAGDLGGLLERARTTGKTETVETEWRSRDGRRRVVKLHAFAARTGSIEIVLEDITDVRALEERLRRAQRMEAVGRLASEVAVTCDGLLRDVIRGANESMAAIGHDAALRFQGERLASDATRAVTLLRQLAIYGEKQSQVLEPVSAQRVLQDLAPVLKGVVGDQIELVLTKSSGSFFVDVPAERLERVLVNVAGYARQRMPDGGQMRIDLATTAVGRRFIASHPGVRPGDHVLITVTEVPGGTASRAKESGAGSFDNVSVDLSALVELVGSCGGHLWMEAQPAGNMVVKIHLPKRAPAAIVAGPDRVGRLARWFRSAPATTTIRA
jgi:signal transduction histidine kinase